MVTKQPQFTQAMRDKLNKMYRLLCQRFYTKQELMDIFQLGERQVRMMITEISHKVPVISTSGTNNGYKVARTVDDLQMVEYSWAEKRMFSKKIIDTDWFMDMPASTQNF